MSIITNETIRKQELGPPVSSNNALGHDPHSIIICLSFLFIKEEEGSFHSPQIRTQPVYICVLGPCRNPTARQEVHSPLRNSGSGTCHPLPSPKQPHIQQPLGALAVRVLGCFSAKSELVPIGDRAPHCRQQHPPTCIKPPQC